MVIEQKQIDDDPLNRLIDRAVQAQTRLLLNYIESTRGQMMADVAHLIKEEFGGDQLYIGKGPSDKNHARDLAIWRDAQPVARGGQGLSLRALGKKYHLGKSRIAEVLATIKEEMPEATNE